MKYLILEDGFKIPMDCSHCEHFILTFGNSSYCDINYETITSTDTCENWEYYNKQLLED